MDDNNNNNTKISIAPYSKALTRFTIKCLKQKIINSENTRAKLQIKIVLEKISFKVALKLHFICFGRLFQGLGAQTQKASKNHL